MTLSALAGAGMLGYGAYALQSSRMDASRCAAFDINAHHVTAHQVATCAGATVSVPFLGVGMGVMGIVVFLAIGTMFFRRPDRGGLIRGTKGAYAAPLVSTTAGWKRPGPGQELRWWTGSTWGPWQERDHRLSGRGTGELI